MGASDRDRTTPGRRSRSDATRAPGPTEPPATRDLLHNTNFLLAVVAQFFYVGAQVGIWSYLIRYAQQALPGLPESRAADFLTIALVLFMCGRFAGTALMRYLSPARLLAIFALVAFALAR